MRDRRGEVLFIDARKTGALVDRTRKEFSAADIAKIADVYHAWRGGTDANSYSDVPGFCKAVTLEELRVHGHVLTHGRYVGATDVEDDEVPFATRLAALRTKLASEFNESARLTNLIEASLSGILIDAE